MTHDFTNTNTGLCNLKGTDIDYVPVGIHDLGSSLQLDVEVSGTFSLTVHAICKTPRDRGRDMISSSSIHRPLPLCFRASYGVHDYRCNCKCCNLNSNLDDIIIIILILILILYYYYTFELVTL